MLAVKERSLPCADFMCVWNVSHCRMIRVNGAFLSRSREGSERFGICCCAMVGPAGCPTAITCEPVHRCVICSDGMCAWQGGGGEERARMPSWDPQDPKALGAGGSGRGRPLTIAADDACVLIMPAVALQPAQRRAVGQRGLCPRALHLVQHDRARSWWDSGEDRGWSGGRGSQPQEDGPMNGTAPLRSRQRTVTFTAQQWQNPLPPVPSKRLCVTSIPLRGVSAFVDVFYQIQSGDSARVWVRIYDCELRPSASLPSHKA